MFSLVLYSVQYTSLVIERRTYICACLCVCMYVCSLGMYRCVSKNLEIVNIN